MALCLSIRNVASCGLASLSMIACGGGGGGGPEKDLTVGFYYPDRDLELFQSFADTPQISGLEGNRPSCRVVSGNMPDGLVVNSDCTVSGRTLKPAITSAVVELTVPGYKGSVTSNLRFSVATPTISWAGGSNSDGSINHVLNAGQPVSQTAVTVNKVTPSADKSLAFRLTSGSLPNGLEIDAATGALKGQASDPGDFKFSIGATLNAGANSFVLNEVQLNIRLSYAWVNFSYESSSDSNVGTEVNQAVTTNYVAVPGSSVRYSIAEGALKAGLKLDSETGRIFGVPEMPKDVDEPLVNTIVRQTITLPGGQQSTRLARANFILAWPTVPFIHLPVLWPGSTFSSGPQIIRNSLPGDSYRFSLRLKPKSSYNGNLSMGVVPSWINIDSTTGNLYGQVPTADLSYQYELEMVLIVERNGRSFEVFNPFNLIPSP